MRFVYTLRSQGRAIVHEVEVFDIVSTVRKGPSFAGSVPAATAANPAANPADKIDSRQGGKLEPGESGRCRKGGVGRARAASEATADGRFDKASLLVSTKLPGSK